MGIPSATLLLILPMKSQPLEMQAAGPSGVILPILCFLLLCLDGSLGQPVFLHYKQVSDPGLGLKLKSASISPR